MFVPTAKHLSTLLNDLPAAHVHGAGDPLVRSIVYDSRTAQPGSLFVAMRGKKADGTTFIQDALARGAVAVVSEPPLPDLPVPVIEVPNARRALAELAWSLYDHPERNLTLLAVTGTNGKTTIATQLRAVLRFAGKRTGMVGTLGIHYDEPAVDSPRTTPESVDMAAHFAAMRAQGFSHVVMEATSIGIDLERTWGLPFRVVIFTNLTRDHLDYHGSVDAYREAKQRLFHEQDAAGTAIINRDDPAADYFIAAANGKVVTYAIDATADYRAQELRLTRRGTQFKLQTAAGTADIAAPLIGRFNVHNLLAVIAAARALEIPLETIQAALKEIAPVRGRAEMVPSTAPFTVVVDYAHTPDALEQMLTTLGALEHRRILTVVGAGGDRDKGKRPLMAATAYRRSDRLYLTSDNPRSEDPGAILSDMAAGLPAHADHIAHADRRWTIEQALSDAGEGDIVLIAGKGHETYQEIHGVRHPFDDREVALEWLARAGFAA